MTHKVNLVLELSKSEEERQAINASSLFSKWEGLRKISRVETQ